VHDCWVDTPYVRPAVHECRPRPARPTEEGREVSQEDRVPVDNRPAVPVAAQAGEGSGAGGKEKRGEGVDDRAGMAE
jgi:hypothetical protein